MVAVATTSHLQTKVEYSRESIISSWEQIYAGSPLGIRSPLDLSGRTLGAVRDGPA
jgi:hypothetical protein